MRDRIRRVNLLDGAVHVGEAMLSLVGIVVRWLRVTEHQQKSCFRFLLIERLRRVAERRTKSGEAIRSEGIDFVWHKMPRIRPIFERRDAAVASGKALKRQHRRGRSKVVQGVPQNVQRVFDQIINANPGDLRVCGQAGIDKNTERIVLL